MNKRAILGHYTGAILVSLSLWCVLWLIALFLTPFGWDSFYEVLNVWNPSRSSYDITYTPIIICLTIGCAFAGLMHMADGLVSFRSYLQVVCVIIGSVGYIGQFVVGIGLFLLVIYLLFFEGYILWPFKALGSVFKSIGSWPLFLQIAIGVILGGSVVVLMLSNSNSSQRK